MYRKPVVTLLLIAAVAIMYRFFDPMDSEWMPACAFYRLTGWQCPLCGGQRMMHALLHGDVEEAWRQNAAMLMVLPWVAMTAASYTMQQRLPAIYNSQTSIKAAIAYIAIACIWGVLRNII